MKGLMKYLSPFAPDISGAAEVLFKMKGLIVIIDAGGCTGNVCGFDEPRWMTEKSAVFSAGLRDLDAILGRDEAMMRKVGDVLSLMGGAEFLALVGTPVPSVIATDYRALKRMGERRFNIRTLTVPTTGMELYDKGQERAYMELLAEYAGTKADGGKGQTGSGASAGEGRRDETAGFPDGADRDSEGDADSRGILGIFGATPLDYAGSDDEDILLERVRRCGGYDVRLFGRDVRDFAMAPSFRENLVVSPSGIAPARYMQEKFGVPFRVRYPLPDSYSGHLLSGIEGKRMLIVHQAVLAETLRAQILVSRPETVCDTATFFMPLAETIALKDEDDFMNLVGKGGYDVIIGDPLLFRAVSGCGAQFVPMPHFAVSGMPM